MSSCSAPAARPAAQGSNACAGAVPRSPSPTAPGAHLDALLSVLAPLAGDIPLRGFASDALPPDLPAGLVVINATSSGLRAEDPPPIDLQRLPRPASVFDMIYNPPSTPLLRAPTTLGLRHANGLSMLVHQGAKALEIWSSIPAGGTAPVMQAAARAALNTK